MSRNSPLPSSLRVGPFLVRDAMDAGVTRGRLRGADLAKPFRGVRLDTYDPTDLRHRCLALQARLDPGGFFSHITSALIMGMPLPLRFEQDPLLHVSVFDPLRSPTIRGVVSHQLRPQVDGVRDWRGLRLAAPVHTWCLLAAELAVPDLVAVGDFLVTGDHPLATIDELSRAVGERAAQRGVRKLARALPSVRVGPLSRPETHARLLFMAAGLPEPEINGKIYDSRGRFLAMADLVWRTHRVAYEYEGNHHWSDAGQFRRDILRRERVEDNDWRLVRFTADDIRLRPEETVTRLANRLGLPLSQANLSVAMSLSTDFVL